MKKKLKVFLNIFAYSSVVPILMLGSDVHGQNSAASNVLDRYGNLNITREGPTIDAELAQKMFRRGNTYSNLQNILKCLEKNFRR